MTHPHMHARTRPHPHMHMTRPDSFFITTFLFEGSLSPSPLITLLKGEIVRVMSWAVQQPKGMLISTARMEGREICQANTVKTNSTTISHLSSGVWEGLGAVGFFLGMQGLLVTKCVTGTRYMQQQWDFDPRR
uniref:Uncharacterized protein n=1 Tax=Eutreptiella gymnastica TaxID=73025 RepID=A0A6U8KAC2_9EUGL|mmetsp:Transcript_70304/g.123931  ORF Transcript_70304/g.123931 Transcript_70304/m.123931 type:complete len:133 (+) Transcript_70304:2144-2542(+)